TAAPLFFPADLGNSAQLLGIRADESIMRRRAILAKSTTRIEPWIIPVAGNLWKGYPVYDWAEADLWTAFRNFGWDYNEAYDVMEMAGMPPGRQRCAPPFGEQPMINLWMYAECFPEIWDRMTERVPGAQTAARYASTELYSYGTRMDK